MDLWDIIFHISAKNWIEWYHKIGYVQKNGGYRHFLHQKMHNSCPRRPGSFVSVYPVIQKWFRKNRGADFSLQMVAVNFFSQIVRKYLPRAMPKIWGRFPTTPVQTRSQTKVPEGAKSFAMKSTRQGSGQQRWRAPVPQLHRVQSEAPEGAQFQALSRPNRGCNGTHRGCYCTHCTRLATGLRYGTC